MRLPTTDAVHKHPRKTPAIVLGFLALFSVSVGLTLWSAGFGFNNVRGGAPPRPSVSIEPDESLVEFIGKSVLHPRTAPLPRANSVPFEVEDFRKPFSDQTRETTETFPLYGSNKRGIHYRLDNDAIIQDGAHDMVLIVLVYNDEKSWGETRSVEDFFDLIATFTHPPEKTAVTMLTSSKKEFDKVQSIMKEKIPAYAQFSLLYRNDLDTGSKLTRENRHDQGVQNVRRRMLARYRNYALLSTLETWHQHVVWLDADVYSVPSELVSKMIKADRDILEPICVIRDRDSDHDREYDFNAWVGTRTQPKSAKERNGFVPNPLDINRISDFSNKPHEYIALDSVGGTMLYVRADIHRQGVLFPHHYVIGSEWNAEGYDGIETEGLCYSAHFLGFRCWGMPHEVIHHYSKPKNWTEPV
ncbi:hypothetical protein Poli38472_011957 [Pythium oligandrum]|uniref:Uncharacterized protein n=1 Tax=Pythium oligandrum TaxID=41045 RepID=A0A8K1FL73_PYTOL|nr:hypothetical protein Poli38472_011957 [Pythium oligandrum]|eukprot:TMW66841.1 hypothetical protein Poli38472_011957 [Pythium oligandrum]